MKKEVIEAFKKHLKKYGLKQRYENDVNDIIGTNHNLFCERTEAIFAIRRLINTNKIPDANEIYGKCADDWDAIVTFQKYSGTLDKYCKAFEMGKVVQAIKFLRDKGAWNAPAGLESVRKQDTFQKIPQAIYELFQVTSPDYPIHNIALDKPTEVEEEPMEEGTQAVDLPPSYPFQTYWKEEWRPTRYIKPEADKQPYIIYNSMITNEGKTIPQVSLAIWNEETQTFLGKHNKEKKTLAWIPLPAFDLLSTVNTGLQFPMPVLYGNLVREHNVTRAELRKQTKKVDKLEKLIEKHKLSNDVQETIVKATEHIDKQEETIKSLNVACRKKSEELVAKEQEIQELKNMVTGLQDEVANLNKKLSIGVKKVIPLSAFLSLPLIGAKAMVGIIPMLERRGIIIDENK